MQDIVFVSNYIQNPISDEDNEKHFIYYTVRNKEVYCPPPPLQQVHSMYTFKADFYAW